MSGFGGPLYQSATKFYLFECQSCFCLSHSLLDFLQRQEEWQKNFCAVVNKRKSGSPHSRGSEFQGILFSPSPKAQDLICFPTFVLPLPFCAVYFCETGEVSNLLAGRTPQPESCSCQNHRRARTTSASPFVTRKTTSRHCYPQCLSLNKPSALQERIGCRRDRNPVQFPGSSLPFQRHTYPFSHSDTHPLHP